MPCHPRKEDVFMVDKGCDKGTIYVYNCHCWKKINKSFTGPTGATGNQGNTGFTGPTGPMPSFLFNVQSASGPTGLQYKVYQ